MTTATVDNRIEARLKRRDYERRQAIATEMARLNTTRLADADMERIANQLHTRWARERR
jgi:hypothetical protein